MSAEEIIRFLEAHGVKEIKVKCVKEHGELAMRIECIPPMAGLEKEDGRRMTTQESEAKSEAFKAEYNTLIKALLEKYNVAEEVTDCDDEGYGGGVKVFIGNGWDFYFEP